MLNNYPNLYFNCFDMENISHSIQEPVSIFGFQVILSLEDV